MSYQYIRVSSSDNIKSNGQGFYNLKEGLDKDKQSLKASGLLRVPQWRLTPGKNKRHNNSFIIPFQVYYVKMLNMHQEVV